MTGLDSSRKFSWRGIAFTLLFLGWTVEQCLVQTWRLVLPGGRLLPAVLTYVKGIDRLERRCLGLTYRVIGTLPRHGPALVAMKHQSAWETLKLHLLFDDPAIVIKQELLRIPLWGRYAAALDMIPIDRKAGSEALLRLTAAACKAAADRRVIVIFPEGTRVPPGAHRPYKGGVARIYEATGLPIVPVALNSGLYWPKGLWGKRPGLVTMRVLEPIPAGMEPKAALRLLQFRLDEASDALLADTGAEAA